MNKNKKIICSVTAMLLAVMLLVTSVLTMGKQEVSAQTRLYGVQKVINNMSADDPLVMVEIVPDKAMASLGYYVRGSEPVLDSKLLETYMNTSEISDTDTVTDYAQIRANAVKAYFNDIYEENGTTKVVKLDTSVGQTIENSRDPIYSEVLYKPSDMDRWGSIHAEDGTYFREIRYGYFEKAEFHNLDKGNYRATYDDEGKLVSYTFDKENGEYVWVDAEYVEATDPIVQQSTPTANEPKEDLEQQDLPEKTDLDESGEDGTEGGSEGGSGGGAEGGSEGGSEGGTEGSTEEQPETEVEVEPVPQYVNLIFDSLYYRVNVVSNGLFMKHVFEREYGDEVREDIKVISLTPEELEAGLLSGDISGGTLQQRITLNEVDLMYISNTTCLNISADLKNTFERYTANAVYTADKTGDISWDTAYNIYQYVLNTNLPVIVDEPLVSATTAEKTLVTANNNILRLAYLLKAYDSESEMPSANNFSAYVTTQAEDAALGAFIAAGSYITSGHESLKTKGSVQGSVYINKSGSIVNNVIGTAVINSYQLSDQVTTYSSNDIAGMSAIVSEITNENFYNSIHNTQFVSEYKKNNNTETIEVWQSTLVKYIINYRFRRVSVYKDKIRVLDIEPTKYSKLTESQIRTWLGHTNASAIVQEIEIVQTTTSEFIGKIVDLNETYDMIYIGSCIGPEDSGKNTFPGSMNQKEGKTVYNDGTMDNLIYTHVGDKVEVENKLAGLFTTDYTSGTTNKQLKDQDIVSRYSGNDITKEKLEDLKKFVSSGYPVVISNTFYQNKTVNTTYVDASSYMYEFMASYTGNNVVENVIPEPANGASAALITYINMPKLTLSMVSTPVEYAVVYNPSDGYKSIKSVTCMTPVDNKYNLNYTFEFSDTSEALGDNTNYKVELFVDVNADGRYADTERLDGLTVYETQSGKDVNYNELKTGVRYTVSRELPENFRGVVPWYLRISLLGADGNEAGVRASSSGYTSTAYRAGIDETIPIRIFQLQSSVNQFKEERLSLADSSKFKTLFAEVKQFMGYDVSVTVQTVNDYVKEYMDYKKRYPTSTVSDFYNSKFGSYDMLVIGFSDCYSDIHYSNGGVESTAADDENATLALKMFIESGRSVLFSHDTTSFANADRTIFKRTADNGNLDHDNSNQSLPYFYWGYQLNQHIRSLVGMDRYGITETDLSLLKNGANLSDVNTTITVDGESKKYQDYAINTLEKDVAYTPSKNTSTGKKSSLAGVQGFSNSYMDLTGINAKESSNHNYLNYTSDTQGISNNITQVNKGQITSYPYDLNDLNPNVVTDTNRSKLTNTGSTAYYQMQLEKAAVMKTHTQYYQLDMQDDMVVWYCLADGVYDASPNDVRNNYYIYNVNNVTYTGMGHFQDGVDSSSLDTYETRLFINTMIASYNSGKVNPSVSFVTDADNKSSSLEYIYRTYDEELGYEDRNNETIHFYANDNNIINGRRELLAKYYYPVAIARKANEVSSSGTTTKYEDGAITNVYEVPVVVTKGNVELADNNNGTYKTIVEGNDIIFLRTMEASYITEPNKVNINDIMSFELDYSWISAAFSSKSKIVLPRIYIGMQTKLLYDYDNQLVDYTDEVFDYVAFKQRSLYNLD